MLLEESENNAVWGRIEKELHFSPSVEPNITPFSIKVPYVIYDISGMSDAQIDDMEDLITTAFIHCTKENELLYALDWQHSGFIYDPRNDDERNNIWVKDDRYLGGGYHAYFPGYYPDGDYYFFLDCKFRFGYLGHPWQQRIWIFGNDFIHEFKSIESRLGWCRVSYP